MESQNHTIVYVGKDHPLTRHCQVYNWTTSLSATRTWHFYTFRVSTTCLDSLFKCLTNLWVKNLFPNVPSESLLGWVPPALSASPHSLQWTFETSKLTEGEGVENELRELATAAKKPKTTGPFIPKKEKELMKSSHLTWNKLIFLCKVFFWRGLRLRPGQHNTAPAQNLNEQENLA